MVRGAAGSRGGGTEASASFIRDHARTLYHAGRLAEARAFFSELARHGGPGGRPVGHHHPQLQAHLDEGYLAVIAAREGANEETDRWCTYLEELREPFLHTDPHLLLLRDHPGFQALMRPRG